MFSFLRVIIKALHHKGVPKIPGVSTKMSVNGEKLLVFSSFVFEVIYSLPEERHAEKTTFIVFIELPAEYRGKYVKTRNLLHRSATKGENA